MKRNYISPYTFSIILGTISVVLVLGVLATIISSISLGKIDTLNNLRIVNYNSVNTTTITTNTCSFTSCNGSNLSLGNLEITNGVTFSTSCNTDGTTVSVLDCYIILNQNVNTTTGGIASVDVTWTKLGRTVVAYFPSLVTTNTITATSIVAPIISGIPIQFKPMGDVNVVINIVDNGALSTTPGLAVFGANRAITFYKNNAKASFTGVTSQGSTEFVVTYLT